MHQPKKSMDIAVLGLIEHLENRGFLKLSARRYREAPPPISYRPDDLLRTQAAAALLHVSAKTLANWRVRGFGPRFVKSGSLVTYRFADLQSFISSNSFGSTSEQTEGSANG